MQLRQTCRLTRRTMLTLWAAAGAALVACGRPPAFEPPAKPAEPAKPADAPKPVEAAKPAEAKPAAPAPAPAQQAPAQKPAEAAKPAPAASGAPGKYNEAPQLAQLAKDGKLPPVDQRVPKSPLVVQPVERVGKYGGDWRSALVGGQDTAWLTRTLGYEHLVRWDREWNKVVPNVAESFEANQAATEFTFKLREGMKWSDGQPYTADDIMFWWEDVCLNPELSPPGAPSGIGPPNYMRPGGEIGTVVKVDQRTVQFKFAKPNGLFLVNLAIPGGELANGLPKHYLQQFHKKYNPSGVEALAKENSAEDWVKLFRLKGVIVPGTPYNAIWNNKDLPQLLPWSLTTAYGQGTRVVAERNPYYFKVDTEGNQLPYLDRVIYDVMQDNQVLLLKALNGELDIHTRHINSLANKAVLSDNQQRGNYQLFELIQGSTNCTTFSLNLTHKDKVKREIFQNKEFRIALSYAINRKEIVDLVFVGQGEPHQPAPRSDSPYYHERLAKQYTEYDVGKANELLDKQYPKKDAEGFRLGPDGQRISFVIEVTNLNPEWPDEAKLVAGYWKKVGIDALVKEMDRSLLYSRKAANEHDVVIWGGGNSRIDAILDPRNYIPFNHESNWAEAWQSWFNNPNGQGALTAPEEPPEPVKKSIQLYRELTATADAQKQKALLMQILDIAADQFYEIGISSRANGYGIIKNGVRNVPKTMVDAWLWPTPAPSDPSQYFIER
jgi:peptide/nickel transport system substrate-binding protein